MAFLPINESETDRGLRIVGGVLLLLTSVVGTPSLMRSLLIAAALVLIITGATGFCAIYTLFGLNTTTSPKSTATKKKRSSTRRSRKA